MSHIDLCTLELVCARDKTVVARLRVEMRDRVDMTRIQTPYRKLRISDLANPPTADSDYDWAVAFTEKGDALADGSQALTLKLKIGEGPATRSWLKQEISAKVLKGETVRVEILATAPMKPEVKPQAKPWTPFDAEEARREETTRQEEAARRERIRRNGEEAMRNAWSGMDGFFSQGPLGKKAQAAQTVEGAVWSEIEAVLKRQRYTDRATVSRVRRAMALLLHVDGNNDPSVKDALSKANAFLDEKEAPYKEPLAV
jgi:hypothetical protein